MSKSDILSSVQILKRLIGNSDGEGNDAELTALFDNCMQLRDQIENSTLSSNDNELQEAISICVKGFEKCTLMVNELELFSSNETAEELQTSSIRYLLLPALLGSLNLNIQNKDMSERIKNVEIAEVYFRDFLCRCSNYELGETSLKYFKEILDKESSNERNPDPSSVRERKIQQYKLKKELENREKSLKPALQRPESEEYIRQYYFVLLEKWILIAVDELENLNREKEILRSMPPKVDLSANNTKEKKTNVEPLKPFIITKNAMQKQVFGLGYPSVPVLTVDDFYRQRFEKMVEEQKQNKKGQSLQDTAFAGTGLNKEEEDIQKEVLIENDDPITLMKARQWDDWKDENPRGSGNRYNKG
ncbi:hypothetical protein TNIN_101281 [Trichonephila inaurata madagascariensis]|uniref:Immunoglobulin-binding protein 1 n=1 Tax=Trichonephila inaurata madagascariensis TaxID=2747483 RepID=A0A8X7CJ94_9ARAC|nr:hypothetical protein TNIN_101281 [Trichonephila inaurata madagascariensis]